MAELDVGKHCAVDFCKQLDFLPFTCDGCGKVYCLVHRNKDDHVCNRSLLPDTSPQIYEGQRSFPCSLTGCQKRELAPINCVHCDIQVCLSHRHQQDHDCVKLKVAQADERVIVSTKDHVNAILANKASQHASKPQKRLSAKARKTAAKVSLMKLKMKAAGDKHTPESERMFFNVCLPQGSKVASLPMYFSKEWSIGRMIDNIAKMADLKNDNNTASEKKLRLFCGEIGEIFSTDEKLSDLLSRERLLNGSSLILEYVTSDCFQLENMETYTR